MITLSNGNIFRVTDPVCGEFTGDQWIPLTKASVAELSCFLCLNKRLSKQSWSWGFETSSRSLWRHCNVYWRSASDIHDLTSVHMPMSSLISFLGSANSTEIKHVTPVQINNNHESNTTEHQVLILAGLHILPEVWYLRIISAMLSRKPNWLIHNTFSFWNTLING